MAGSEELIRVQKEWNDGGYNLRVMCVSSPYTSGNGGLMISVSSIIRQEFSQNPSSYQNSNTIIIPTNPIRKVRN
jgi:hypothetical protein